ncbi:MAG: hypothetical protein RIS33_1704, partial [Actinomycetota bacterium]
MSGATHTVLVVGHADRDEADGVAQRAVDWLIERGHRVVATADDRAHLGLSAQRVGDLTDIAAVTLALSIGGDGTMLRTVKLIGGRDVPVLGVNVGLLGYLSEVEPPAIIAALDDVMAGRHALESRTVIDVEVHRSGAVERHRALNEASLEKLTAGHTVRLAVDIDGAPFTTYQADGLIVATPTGSTAYSLSARGPIVSPLLRAVLVTPLSPHMLFDRSLVLGPDEAVVVTVTGSRPVGLAVDGEFLGELRPG